MTPAPDRLQRLQHWMLDALITPGDVDAAALAAAVLPGPKLSASGCLAIYQRSYIQRLRTCLKEQFPASCHAIGAQLFADFADEYLRDCPSESHTLYELGKRFPQWIEDNRPDRGEPAERRETWIDFMVDLAGYERELYRLFDAPGHEGKLWPDTTADDEALVLQPCLALVRHGYPVAWYYHEVRAERSPPFPAARPSNAVILRRDFLTHTYPITPQHHRFLSLMQQTMHVPTALEQVAAETGRDLEEVKRSWRDQVRGPWLEAGFFVERWTLDASHSVV
ncbi:HvfC/BufC N-terminal domain-containing protein [Collimonas humicola]|uniref:HvfC/BufC N-terminal domain-containing protein n=1 Tax=Collimonas humicola TaxID=2825886 RepID=UPI001B8AE898|nr:DNA-binding domain-containing protein [Collimonas humicola]